MSRTYRDKLKAHAKRRAHESIEAYRTWYDSLSYKNEVKAFPGFDHNPGWWNHLFSIVKARRLSKKQLIKILKNPELADDMTFHGYKKPTQYYW